MLAPVAQLDRASGYGPEGREFKSSPAYNNTDEQCKNGSVVMMELFFIDILIISIEEGLMVIELTSAAVKEYGVNAGASVVGVASAADFDQAPEGFKPADALPECQSVIVLGLNFPAEVLNDIASYTASRNESLETVTNIAKKVERRVKASGYKAKAISGIGGKSVEKGGRKEWFGHISLKHAAEIAGLGVIGKNYLLTSPKYGNMLWLSAVLTDARLDPDERLAPLICDNCDKCVEACPAGALNDRASDGRASIDKKGCSRYFVIEEKKLKIKCFKCRAVCPRAFGYALDTSPAG